MRTKNPALSFSLGISGPPIFIAISLSFLLLFFPTKSANATDAPIHIENAIKGQTYVETAIVANPENQENRIMVSSGGDISDWIGFYDNPDSILPLTFLTLPAKSAGIITAKITIPEDMPNGDYKGSITTAIASEDITGLILPQTVQEVKIRIGNKKIIDFDAFIIPKDSTIKKGNILAIKTTYKNRSNIRISPSLEIRIKKDKDVVYHAIFPYPENRPEIVPNLAFEIPDIEISTEGFEPGEYKALIKTSENNDGGGYSSDKEFSFKIAEGEKEECLAGVSGLAGIKNIFSTRDNPPPIAASIPAAIGAYAIFITSKKLFFKLKAKLRYILFRLRIRKIKDD